MVKSLYKPWKYLSTLNLLSQSGITRKYIWGGHQRKLFFTNNIKSMDKVIDKFQRDCKILCICQWVVTVYDLFSPHLEILALERNLYKSALKKHEPAFRWVDSSSERSKCARPQRRLTPLTGFYGNAPWSSFYCGWYYSWLNGNLTPATGVPQPCCR